MSHSRFRRTSGLYLDMHGLIFETSICYWQDQPGISFLTCLASVTRATIFQPALTQECRESPSLRELACRKRRIETNTTDARLRVTAQRSSVQYTTLEPLSEFTCPTARAKTQTLSLSIECLVFQRLVFRSRSPRFGFVRPVFFFWFAFLLRHIMSVYREKT